MTHMGCGGKLKPEIHKRLVMRSAGMRGRQVRVQLAGEEVLHRCERCGLVGVIAAK